MVCGHLTDAANLYRLALNEGEPGARYHAVAEEDVPMPEAAQVVAAHLDLPLLSVSNDVAPQHLGRFARFATQRMPTSSDQPQANGRVASSRGCPKVPGS